MGQTYKKASGLLAPERKYDLLTALGCWAMGQGGHMPLLALRLGTLITARYNWRRDELTCGQREIATLWDCDTRTVKREMSRLRDLGFLTLLRQGARGRVAAYRLEIGHILNAAQDDWVRVGPDFVERMQQGRRTVPADPSNIVHFPGGGSELPPPSEGWAEVAELLRARNAHAYAAWLAPLVGSVVEGVLHLRAPTNFHARHVATHLKGRIVEAARTCGLSAVRIEGVD